MRIQTSKDENFLSKNTRPIDPVMLITSAAIIIITHVCIFSAQVPVMRIIFEIYQAKQNQLKQINCFYYSLIY